MLHNQASSIVPASPCPGRQSASERWASLPSWSSFLLVWGKMPFSVRHSLPVSSTPELWISWKGQMVLLQAFPISLLALFNINHIGVNNLKRERTSTEAVLRGNTAKPRTTEVTDELTFAFILGYFPINQPVPLHFVSKTLHYFLKATKISLFWGQRTHVQELTVVLRVLVPGRKVSCLFCCRESRKALAHWLPTGIVWPRTGQSDGISLYCFQ